MPRLTVYNQVSADGFFADANNDMSWAHKSDPEWNAFVSENAKGGGAFLFGRVTYQMMASFWGSPAGRAANPVVAERMTALPKYVASRTLRDVTWANTTVLGADIAAEVRRLKTQPGPDMVILGSGSIVAQLTEARLIDEYTLVVNPIVLGSGRSMFDGVRNRFALALERTRGFSNGNVVSWYRPA